MFFCYNVNCYASFTTARGLSVHLSYNPACNRYHVTCEWQPPMLQQVQEGVTSLLSNTRAAQLAMDGDPARAHRIWSGTQSGRLNHLMATILEPFEAYHVRELQPAVSPYATIMSEQNNQAFNASNDNSEGMPTHFDGNDDNTFTTYADDDYACTLLPGDPIVQLPEFVPRLHNSQQCPQTQLNQHVFNAMMERHAAEEQQSIQFLAYDIDRRNVIDLMMILERSKCPDYLLSEVLHWAHQAFMDGFHFAPRAFTREANMS